MGIARRKAGTVVRCPTCGGQVVVPDPRQPQPAQEPAKKKKAGGLFEHTDFEKVLRDSPGTPPPPNADNVTSPASAAAGALPRVDVEPVSFPSGLPEPANISFGKFLLLLIVLCVLLGLAFLAGFLVGRSSFE